MSRGGCCLRSLTPLVHKFNFLHSDLKLPDMYFHAKYKNNIWHLMPPKFKNF